MVSAGCWLVNVGVPIWSGLSLLHLAAHIPVGYTGPSHSSLKAVFQQSKSGLDSKLTQVVSATLYGSTQTQRAAQIQGAAGLTPSLNGKPQKLHCKGADT